MTLLLSLTFIALLFALAGLFAFLYRAEGKRLAKMTEKERDAEWLEQQW